jgi:FAD:protein FMN transferase
VRPIPPRVQPSAETSLTAVRVTCQSATRVRSASQPTPLQFRTRYERLCLAVSGFALVALGLSQGCHRSASEAAPRAAQEVGSAPIDAAVGTVRVVVETQAMGTRLSLIVYGAPGVSEKDVRAAIDEAVDEFRRIERLMSTWRPDTEISLVNARAGAWVEVGEDSFRVLEKGLWAGSLSSGAFDLTFETMSDLWKFGGAAEDAPSAPSPALVAQRRALLGYENVELDPRSHQVRIPAGRRIGLGGIAKGYAVDRVVDILRKEGLRDFLVQAGGDLYAAGHKPDGQPWTTGLQDPRGPRGSTYATLELSDQGLSTAGDYERFYIADGKRYHHIIDPRTGYPATASRAVSVLAPDSFTADALDDGVFILGAEEGLAVVERLPDVAAVIVDGDNEVRVSERLRGRLRVTRHPTP